MARRHLNDKTPTESLTGLTPNISHLKFTLWHKSWYYEYNNKFPKIPWKTCRVVGFANHQGNQFTYKVWTVCDDDDWTDVRELTRDIFIPRVIGRKHPATSLLSLTDYEQLQF